MYSSNSCLASVIGNRSVKVIVDSGGFDDVGGVLKPTVASQNQCHTAVKLSPNNLVSDNLDSFFSNFVGNSSERKLKVGA